MYTSAIIFSLLSLTWKANACVDFKCAALETSENSDISSGSNPLLYDLVLSSESYVPGQDIKVKLQMNNFIRYDPMVAFGLKSYKIEVYEKETESPAAGRFTKPILLGEAAVCNEEAATVVYKTCFPSVLDFPVTYLWTPSSDSKTDICFKVTIQQHNNNDKCETLNVTCISPEQTNDITKPPQIEVIAYSSPPQIPEKVKLHFIQFYVNQFKLVQEMGRLQ
jgi:hypothetical protein